MNCAVPLLPLCYHVTRAVNPKLDWGHNTSVQSNISELSTGLDCEPEAAPPHAPCRMSGHSPLGSRLSYLCSFGDLRPAPMVMGIHICFQVPYCTVAQPDWSAYREDAFGHGILEVRT